MTSTIQIGYPMSDGSLAWEQPVSIKLDSRANLLKRWREARTLEAHHITEIPGGIEVDAWLNETGELAGIRQRLVWQS